MARISNKSIEMVMYAVSDIREALENIVGPVECTTYGSVFSGFGSNMSDVDISVSGDFGRDWVLKRIYRLAKEGRIRDVSAKALILNARVPLVRLYDDFSRKEIEVTCENTLAIHNTNMLKCYSRLHRGIPEFVVTIKEWARSLGLTNTRIGFISSYGWTLMCLFFLQCEGYIPSLQALSSARNRKYACDFNCDNVWTEFDVSYATSVPRERRPHMMNRPWDVASLVEDFFIFYRRLPKKMVVSVRMGKALPVSEFPELSVPADRPPFILIEDPFDHCHNIYRGGKAFVEKKLKWAVFNADPEEVRRVKRRRKNLPRLGVNGGSRSVFRCIAGFPSCPASRSSRE